MYQDFIHPIRNPNEWMVPEEVQSKIMLAHNQKRKEEKEITQKKGTNSEMWILWRTWSQPYEMLQFDPINLK